MIKPGSKNQEVEKYKKYGGKHLKQKCFKPGMFSSPRFRIPVVGISKIS